jgi:glutamate formiminotransferase/formiminotetrahydrofolate cyclodeaminase
MALLECVANVSEGQQPEVIAAIASAIRSVDQVQLIHIDSGAAANRTVLTFTGPPISVMEAAFRMYRTAQELIDMSNHRGTHPRQGAVDVCPFIPLSGITAAETDVMVRALAKRLDAELGIGGYFYELSATHGKPSNLATLRKGQYEALPSKVRELRLDFGTEINWKSFGVTVIGCRKLLVAYNVNLATEDVHIAHMIAQHVRESGYLHRDEKGSLKRIKGRLRSVRGMGWYIKDFDCCQASYNLTSLTENGILEVYDATREVAATFNTEVTGSELVGMAPMSEFLKIWQKLYPGKEPDQQDLFRAAEDYLGLNNVKAFNPEKQVLDLLIDQEVDPRL